MSIRLGADPAESTNPGFDISGISVVPRLPKINFFGKLPCDIRNERFKVKSDLATLLPKTIGALDGKPVEHQEERLDGEAFKTAFPRSCSMARNSNHGAGMLAKTCLSRTCDGDHLVFNSCDMSCSFDSSEIGVAENVTILTADEQRTDVCTNSLVMPHNDHDYLSSQLSKNPSYYDLLIQLKEMARHLRASISRENRIRSQLLKLRNRERQRTSARAREREFNRLVAQCSSSSSSDSPSCFHLGQNFSARAAPRKTSTFNSKRTAEDEKVVILSNGFAFPTFMRDASRENYVDLHA